MRDVEACPAASRNQLLSLRIARLLVVCRWISTKGLWPQCVALSSGSNQGGCRVTVTCKGSKAKSLKGLSQLKPLGLRPAQVSQQQLV